MSSQLHDELAERKLKRFITYLMQLEGDEMHEIIKHLPDDFEKEEKETICYHIKQISAKIAGMTCKENCCCF